MTPTILILATIGGLIALLAYWLGKQSERRYGGYTQSTTPSTTPSGTPSTTPTCTPTCTPSPDAFSESDEDFGDFGENARGSAGVLARLHP